MDAPSFGHGDHSRDTRLERHRSVFVFAVVGGHIARVGEGRTEGHVAVHLEGAANVAQDGVGRFVFDGLACKTGGNTPVEGGITATEAKLCGPGVGAVVPCLETVFVATFDVVVTEVIQACRESEFVRKRKAVVDVDETVRTHAVKDNLVQAELRGFHGTHGQRVPGHFGGPGGVCNASSRHGGSSRRNLQRKKLHGHATRVHVPMLPCKSEGACGHGCGKEFLEHTATRYKNRRNVGHSPTGIRG